MINIFCIEMKTARLITPAAIAAILAACTCIQPEDSAPELVTREFSASCGTGTRTEMDGFKVLWSTSGETIDIIDNRGEAYTLAMTALGTDRHQATFSGQVPATGCEYAVYPSGSCSGYEDGAIMINLPTVQTATVDGFANRTNPEVAQVTDSDMLQFRNICALVGIKVNASGISSVRLQGTEDDGGALSGPCLLEFSGGLPVSLTDASNGKNYVELTGGLQSGKQYWMLVHPGSYSEISIIFTDAQGRTATFKHDGKLTLERNKARRISDFTITDSDWDDFELSVNVNTGSISDVGIVSATISGSWSNTNASVREAGFQIGTSSASLDETYQADLSSTGASGSFSVILDNLNPGTVYYYRAYVQLQNGSDIKEFTGQTASFTTGQNPDVPSNQPGWFELPRMNVEKSGKYMINSKDNTQYYAWHICPDVKGPGGKYARNYTVCFSSTHHCPLWVAAPRHSMYVGSSGRNESYKADPDIPAEYQYTSKKTGSGCNKGHMLGSAERTCSKATNQQVFYYSNIAPQLSSGFNTGGGGWNLLEDYVDTQVCADTLYEVLGCYFEKYTDGYGMTQSPKTISFCGRTDVAMPTMFYYVLLRTKSGKSGKSVVNCSADELQCVAFVRTHTNDLKGQEVSSKELMSVSALEKITGVTYFPNVPNAPKGSYSAKDWGL